MSDTAITLQQLVTNLLFQGFWMVFAALFLVGLFIKLMRKYFI